MAESSSQFDLDLIRRSGVVGELRYYPTIESTNDAALDAAREGNFTPPLLLLTDQQTGGRGRGTNRWWSSAGSLTFSLVWQPAESLPRAEWPKTALVAGIAVCQTAATAVPGSSFGLRWPNDVYCGERKVAGILVEAPASADALVIGIGLNVNNSLALAPPDVQARATSLADLRGAPLDMTETLLSLLAQLDHLLAALAIGQDFVEPWQSLCLLTGRVVTLQQGDRTAIGICRGIEASGALVLETERGRERFVAGVIRGVA